MKSDSSSPLLGRVQIRILMITRGTDLRRLSHWAKAVQELDSSGFDLEVCVGIHGASEIFTKSFPGLFLTSLPGHLTLGAARNQLLRQRPPTDWILFLDDDVFAPKDLLQQFGSLLQREADLTVVGGANPTPQESTFFQRASGRFFENPFFCGPFSKRYRAGGRDDVGSERNLILCGLFVKQKEFVEFPTQLTGAEENHLLARMSQRGLKMKWSRDLKFPHQRRPNLSGFLRQIYKYGLGRGQMMGTAPHLSTGSTLLVGCLLVFGLILLAAPSFLIAIALVIQVLGWIWMLVRRVPFWEATVAMLLWVPGMIAYNIGVLRGLMASAPPQGLTSKWPQLQKVLGRFSSP